MQLPDRVTGLAVVALGALTVFGGSRLPPMPGQDVGPSAFPILIGIGLIASGVLVALGIGHRFEEEAEAALAGGDHPPALLDTSPLPPWLRLAVPLAILAPLVVHLVFSKLLRVALPPGLLPMPW